MEESKEKIFKPKKTKPPNRKERRAYLKSLKGKVKTKIKI